jgi:hypothetical protein
MRVVAIMALALLVACCNGDRLKQGTNMHQPSNLSRLG